MTKFSPKKILDKYPKKLTEPFGSFGEKAIFGIRCCLGMIPDEIQFLIYKKNNLKFLGKIN